jgi:hypothetical protein
MQTNNHSEPNPRPSDPHFFGTPIAYPAATALSTDRDWPCPRTKANIDFCMSVIRRWTVPSHRAAWDWHKELRQLACQHAWLAEHDLLEAMLIDFDYFMRRRVLGRAFAHYRSELSRARRFFSTLLLISRRRTGPRPCPSRRRRKMQFSPWCTEPSERFLPSTAA